VQLYSAGRVRQIARVVDQERFNKCLGTKSHGAVRKRSHGGVRQPIGLWGRESLTCGFPFFSAAGLPFSFTPAQFVEDNYYSFKFVSIVS